MEPKWWQKGIVYQIYPRSFQDTTGNGVGDLKGIERRLPHLVALGIDAIWVSPVFPSPMRDFGYDVSDYCDVDPLFGSLADLDELIVAAHSHNMKIILDFVPNHTSELHPWFQESRSARNSVKRDWYIWRDAKPDGSPPNNWASEFGGPAWTFDARTGQYFYHAFLKEQPDLNWRNPEVRAAMHDVLRFWLQRGVDGFRIDAIHHLIEDEELRDNPSNPAWRKGMPPRERWFQTRTVDQPDAHDAIRELRLVVDSFDDRVIIGEAYLPIGRLVTYYGEELGGVHLPFNFHLIAARWRPRALASLIDDYESALPAGGWPNWVLGNHDRSRVASRVGPAQARVAAMLLLTLRGTPTIYQGEEIGMTDVPIAPDLVQDPFEKNVPGLGLGRDPERTPMPWSPGPNAGFSTGRPWLPIGDDGVNVETQAADPRSVLSLYRALIRLRRSQDVLASGEYRLRAATDHVLAYERRHRGAALLIVLNLTSDPRKLILSEERHEVVLSTYLDQPSSVSGKTVSLRSDEGLILRWETGEAEAP